jgi:DNA-binding NarL/FixJ family response regulator
VWIGKCSVHPEPVAQVNAEKIHRPQRTPEEPLDQLVTTCVGGTIGRHRVTSLSIGRSQQHSPLGSDVSTSAALREREVFELIAQGFTNAEIAATASRS